MRIECLVRYAVSMALLAAINSPRSSFAQGSLSPPGPPAPTMKTLAQIEPRTPISALPYTISQPGSYYFTTNLTYAAGNAITVTANNVTIDLNGFALTGGGTNSVFTGISSSGSSLAVHNGTISGWLYGANASGPNNNFADLLFSVGAPGGFGLQLSGGGNRVADCVFGKWGAVLGTSTGDAVLDCSVSGSPGAAALNVSDGCTISRCTVSFVRGGVGIMASRGSTISQCNSYFNNAGISGAVGCLIVDCAAVGNDQDGIDSGDNSTIKHCSVSVNGFSGITTGQGSTVQDCTAEFNLSGNGIFAGSQCVISGCSVNANGLVGVVAGTGSTIRDCTMGGQSFAGTGLATSNSCTVIACGVSSNSIGISAQSGCSFIGCTVENNNGAGISLVDDGVVKDCVVRANAGNGVSANNHLLMAGCTLASNTGTGVVANLVCKVADCVAVLNGGFGISLGIHGQVTGCHVNANTSGGIRVTSVSLVRDNMVDFHQTTTTTPGISVSGGANRIEGNNVTRAGHGLDVSGTQNLVVRNSVSSSTGVNYNVVANNNVGVIVQATLSGAISGNSGGAGLGTTDPWANFSY